MRGSQFVRQWRVLKLLHGSVRGIRASDLAEKVGVSKRTIYRDLEVLQAAGFPLYQEKIKEECWGGYTLWRVLKSKLVEDLISHKIKERQK